MALIYYPTRIYKKIAPTVDRRRKEREVEIIRGSKNITSEALDVYIYSENSYRVDFIQFNFNNSTSKNYAAKIANGRTVVEDINDSLWFQLNDTLWDKIILTPGFYTGDTLATELEDKMNNSPILSASDTFSVNYSSTTGKFIITPSSKSLKFIDFNKTQQLSDRQSLGGHLFGLTSDTDFSVAIESDTECFGLNNETSIYSYTGDTETEHYHDDIHVLDVDQAIHLTTNTASVIVDYSVGKELLKEF